MALDLPVMRSALAAQIRDYVSEDVNVYDGYRPASPTVPCLIILPADDGPYVDYEGTLGRPVATVRFSVQVLVRPGVGASGQMMMDSFVSSGSGAVNSVLDALRADPKLGGAAPGGVIPQAWDHRGQVSLGDSQAFAEWASLTVEVQQPA